MESIALVLTDASLADCIEKLGDHADNPTSEQLGEVLPGLIERHGLAITRMMLASTVAGEAAAANIIRDLLKHDDVVKLPREEPRPIAPPVTASEGDETTPSVKRSRPSGSKHGSASRRRQRSVASSPPATAAASDRRTVRAR